MENIWTEFLKIYGPAIIYAVITAIAGITAKAIAKLYNKYADSKEKRDVAKTVVMAVEQICKDMHGEAKFEKALEWLCALLQERGIEVTPLEARALIEAAVGEFNKVFDENVEPIQGGTAGGTT